MSSSRLVRVTILVGLAFGFYQWFRRVFMGAPEPSEPDVAPASAATAETGEATAGA